jgi:hypothetical protein
MIRGLHWIEAERLEEFNAAPMAERFLRPAN